MFEKLRQLCNFAENVSRMKRTVYVIAAALLLAACGEAAKEPSGESIPDLGWLFLEEGPYTLKTKVEAASGPASFALVRDISLMDAVPEEFLKMEVTVAADSSISVPLGQLEPGFYQVRLRDSIRWNIGIRPDDVISVSDSPGDFDAFWESTLKALEEVPLEPILTEIPEHSNELRTCYEVRYASLGGAVSGGILTVPNSPGKHPAVIAYMGYGAEPYHEDPSAHPERIDYLVSVRDQGIFKADNSRWIDRGLDSKENFYYRGAYCDVKRAVDFIASLDEADPERIVAYGESQGGAFTFVSAALDKRVKAIAPSVPFLGDFPDYHRIVWWPMHEVFEELDKEGLSREAVLAMMRYFDVKNFAPKITCPVYMAFGLQDPTCPPHTNFAIYNNLSSREKRFLCIPTCDHQMWKEPLWESERAGFLERFSE